MKELVVEEGLIPLLRVLFMIVLVLALGMNLFDPVPTSLLDFKKVVELLLAFISLRLGCL
jgi:hypothetical protein